MTHHPLRYWFQLMQVFTVDLALYASDFARQGYCVVPAALSEAFLGFARAQAQALKAAPAVRFDVAGKKLQRVFEFPAGFDFETGVRLPLARLFGVSPEALTLSERHLNVYLPGAPEQPAPHKDRKASEMAVGLLLEDPQASELILYPQSCREPNPFDSASEWRRSLAPEQWPEVLLAGVEPVRISSRPGDLVAFRGSSMYHERLRPAGAEILYLKCNTLGLDPLGEEIRPEVGQGLAL